VGKLNDLKTTLRKSRREFLSAKSLQETQRFSTVACIPTYNQERTIAPLVIKAQKYVDVVIVCDDSSEDLTSTIAQRLGALVIKIPLDRGKRAAIHYALEHALELAPDIVVTLEVDGQYDPDCIPQLIESIKDGEVDIAIGSRYTEDIDSDVAVLNNYGLQVIKTVLRENVNRELFDVQSGFKAFSREVLEKIVGTNSNGFCLDKDYIQKFIQMGFKIRKVPLNINYSELKSSISLSDDLIKHSIDKPLVSYLSTYPPRECGIATFTSDLVDEISRLNAVSPPIITAVNEKAGYYNYPSQVKLQIEREDPESYIKVANKINQSSIDVLNIQHEYGLFGGDWGDYLIDFMEALNKPIVTTLHTILENPTPEAKHVMKEILRLSNQVVVLARVGAKILEQKYDTPMDKIIYIPHGCPNVPKVQSSLVKEGLGLGDRFILSSFGLLSSGKGLEYAIQALPPLVDKHPDLLYLIIGETHPEVRKNEGESYRQMLIRLTETLGLRRNVRFVNRFLSKSELIRFLQATDIYILAYPNKDQISSGTLLYALCTGNAIISTPFLHAEEVINHGAAMRCDFKNPDSISLAVEDMIENDYMRNILGERAYAYSRDMIWPNVAMNYVNVFYKNLEHKVLING
jgi:glycosyltransferase involved in cell wall biosynthesis